MAEKSELLLEVLPCVPVRHWVTTFPAPLRYLLSYDAELTGLLTRAAVDSVFSWLRHRAKALLSLDSVSEAHCGALTSVQRAR